MSISCWLLFPGILLLRSHIKRLQIMSKINRLNLPKHPSNSYDRLIWHQNLILCFKHIDISSSAKSGIFFLLVIVLIYHFFGPSKLKNKITYLCAILPFLIDLIVRKRNCSMKSKTFLKVLTNRGRVKIKENKVTRQGFF